VFYCHVPSTNKHEFLSIFEIPGNSIPHHGNSTRHASMDIIAHGFHRSQPFSLILPASWRQKKTGEVGRSNGKSPFFITKSSHIIYNYVARVK
jgi:hypothetical protein